MTSEMLLVCLLTSKNGSHFCGVQERWKAHKLCWCVLSVRSLVSIPDFCSSQSCLQPPPLPAHTQTHAHTHTHTHTHMQWYKILPPVEVPSHRLGEKNLTPWQSFLPSPENLPFFQWSATCTVVSSSASSSFCFPFSFFSLTDYA